MTTSFRPGHVDIQELFLITPAGDQIDLRNLFVEMSIYENISASSLSGVIVIADTHNLISTLPILGEEWLMFTYKVLDIDEPKALVFRTYKVDDRDIQGNKQVYKIYFTSLEMYIDSTMNISKTFSGTAETIISQLITTELASPKTLTADKSGNQLKITAPWWSPLTIVSWATQKAVSADKHRSTDFLFYETLSGYKFRNMSLAKVRKPITQFFYDQSRGVDDTYTRQVGQEMAIVLDFYTPLVVDQIDRFRHPVYKKEVYSHDLTFKALNVHKYNLFDQWPNMFKLNEHKLCTNSLESFVSPDISFAVESAYLYDDKPYDWQGLISSHRTPSLMLHELMKINIEVWGRNGLEPGDVVDVRIAKFTQSSEPGHDEVYSGNYLISAINHRFAPNEYKMYMQLVKDSVNTSFN